MTKLGISGDLTRYRRLAVCGGFTLTATLASVFIEYQRLRRTLNQLICTDVLDSDKNRPDYIYIKYSVYRESMAALHKKQFDQNWVDVVVHPFGKWWKSIKHSVAWRLLEVAKTGGVADRQKAIHTLAKIDHLKDWDYQHLAQSCDARTAISLARHECDARWFIQPKARGSVRLPMSLIAEMRDYLTLLTKDCKCVRHLRRGALNNFDILRGFAEGEKVHKPFGLSSISKQEYTFITQLLQVMYHITRNRDYAKKLIDSGFMQTLVEVQKLFYYNTEVLFLLAKIMSNLSRVKGVTNDFFVTGWVGLLASMSRHPDLRVQVTAAKALTNMDENDYNRFDYPSRVYPLYPKFCSRQKPHADIVFVHGLLGGVFVTWRQKDREEAQLGLYGKNAFYNNKDKDDIQHMIEEYNRNAPKSERNRRRCCTPGGNRVRVEGSRVLPAKPSTNGDDTFLYNESSYIRRVARKQRQSHLSDEATNELIEALNDADEITPEWEVVYADCPTDSSTDADGPFSISGNEWSNESPDEYTYCWPMDWLPEDYPSVRVLGLNYETALSEWYTNHHATCPCEKSGTLHNRSADMLQALVESGAGENGRPIVWVVHSMGGLIAKSIIVQAAKSDDPAIRQIAENSRAMLFLGTPHKGSSVAKLKQHTQLLLSPTVEVKELEENSAYLLNLHQKFEKFLDHTKMHIVSIAEGSPTMLTSFKFPIQIVPEESAKLPVGDHYVLNVDHLGLSKPVLRQSFLYQRLLAMVGIVLDDEEKKLERLAKDSAPAQDPSDELVLD